jgi:hypothetical protein
MSHGLLPLLDHLVRLDLVVEVAPKLLQFFVQTHQWMWKTAQVGRLEPIL